ncbi:DNA cytosine methyltransferase [Micropruina sp.]|uniref:DNA cytosine methyltransferase n=1 Tax=Micropruina sp. TaxID=2737536 RepID=UPI0039E495D1
MSLTVTDLFAGFGGASSGAVLVPDVHIQIAANHWALAVEVHNLNHPTTDHAQVDLHLEDPRFFPATDVLWASPECTAWSQAGGGKHGPLSGTLAEPDLFSVLDEDQLLTTDEDEATRSRLLMFDVLRFIEHHRYRAVVVENVVDIATQAKYARAWAAWKRGLTNLGYQYRVVSLNSMHAQALGLPAPQSRDRLYIIAWPAGDRAPDVERFIRPKAWCPRCGTVGESRQAWKNGRTVGRYRAQYVYVCAAPGCGQIVEPGWLPAAAAIDWTLTGTRIGDRAKPLAPKTIARIKAGIARYWAPFHLEAGGNQYDAADPRHPRHGQPDAYYRAWPVEEYLRVLHASESKALVVPVEGRDGKQARTAGESLRTLTTRAETALAMMPFLAELRGGGSDARSALQALGTITAGGNHHGLVTNHRFEYRVGTTDTYLPTVTASGNHLGLVTPPAFLTQFRDRVRDLDPHSEHLPTIVADGANHALLTPYYSASGSARPTDTPVGTLTTHDRYGLVMRNNTPRTGDGAEMSLPISEALRTLTTTGHQSLITADDITDAQVDDCYFRMLEPSEIGIGMAFDPNYIVRGSRRDQVRGYGNAVTPPAARDLVACVAESLGVDAA